MTVDSALHYNSDCNYKEWENVSYPLQSLPSRMDSLIALCTMSDVEEQPVVLNSPSVSAFCPWID